MLKSTVPTRLLLVGPPASEFRLAAGMARDAGAEVATADHADAALDELRERGGDIVLIDVDEDIAGFIVRLRSERISTPVLACGIDASAARAVAAIRAGARDYVPLPPQRDLIAAAITSVARHAASLIGNDPALERAASLGLAMAQTSASLLICGERGTGKELMARTIHDASGRPGRFLIVDCSNVDREIVESELFGHEPGAFPGAVARRIGRIESAAEGTVFLREVGDLCLTTQLKLLSVLQTQTIHRLGGQEATALRARIVVGTSTDMEARCEAGHFHASLLARLGLVRLKLPRLCERQGDIERLAQHFAKRLAFANGLPARHFGPAALDLLRRYSWPGNISELEYAVHRAVLLSNDAEIAPEAIVMTDGSSLASIVRARPLAQADGQEGETFVAHTVEDMERELILNTLRHCRGNRTTASTILGISVRTMRNKLRTFIEAGIPVAPAL